MMLDYVYLCFYTKLVIWRDYKCYTPVARSMSHHHRMTSLFLFTYQCIIRWFSMPAFYGHTMPYHAVDDAVSLFNSSIFFGQRISILYQFFSLSFFLSFFYFFVTASRLISSFYFAAFCFIHHQRTEWRNFGLNLTYTYMN